MQFKQIRPNLTRSYSQTLFMFVQITFETRKRNTGFYVLGQGVPQERSSEGYASFKQIKSSPWHVEVIPRVSVV